VQSLCRRFFEQFKNFHVVRYHVFCAQKTQTNLMRALSSSGPI